MKLKTPTLKQINAEIAKRNATFDAANAAQKRVLLAKDALKQVSQKRIRVTVGDWVNFTKIPTTPDGMDYETHADSSLQCAILAGQTKCKACALGGLMVSAVAFKNRVTIADGYSGFSRNGRGDYLDEYFDSDQLRLIEICFESGSGWYSAYRLEEKAAVKWGRSISSSPARFEAIMRNIVRNKGTFKIPGFKAPVAIEA